MLCCFSLANAGYATTNDFINAPIPSGKNWVSRGSTTTDGWYELTTAKANQTGYTYYNQDVASTDGLIIEFDFSASQGGCTRGNDGQCLYGRQPADGFSVFLFDATTPFKLGNFGGALGYGRGSGNTGLAGAYVGVGFDTFGNFGASQVGAVPGGYLKPGADSIVIRGPEQTDYLYIAGKKLSQPISTWNTGRSSRKAKISITPFSGRYKVSAQVEGDPVMVSGTIQQKIPASLKLGFAASTGSNWSRQEIRNVRVRRPVQLMLTQQGETEYPENGKKVHYVLETANLGNKSGINGATLQLTVPDFLDSNSLTFACVKDGQTPGASCRIDQNTSKPVFNLPVGAKAKVELTARITGHHDGDLVAETGSPTGLQ